MLQELRNRNTLLIAAIALVAGIVFGWMVLGWILFPVVYKDGNPPGLAAVYKTDYIQMVADSYAVEADLGKAQSRLAGFDAKDLAATFAKMKGDLQSSKKDAQAARVQRLADNLGIALAPAGTPFPASTPGTQPSAAAPAPLPLGLIFGGLGLLLILAGAAGIAYFAFTRRRAGGTPLAAPRRDPARTEPSQPYITQESTPGAAATPAAAAPVLDVRRGDGQMGHFVTTYKLGDDGYDTSFSIELPSGEFLGECGVGIAEVVGEGPQKVTAFEVWLFDKNDIKTVTKVLMSSFAYNNENIRRKLQARGDAVLATPGQDLILETEALQVRAVVSDVGYGSGGAPQSFFSKLTIEMAPTVKGRVPA
jgi:hypothetical protein